MTNTGSSILPRKRIIVVPHFKRLHELVAYDKGYFAEEGLDAELRDDVLNQTHNAPDFPRISGEELAEEKTPSMNAACNWGVCVSAGAMKGKLVGDVYMRTENAIFATPGSRYKTPDDLAGVAVAVGELSGSHFSGIQSLERHLQRDKVKIKFAGGPATRLKKMISGELEVANLLPPGIYIARQLGFRELITGWYKTLLWAGNVNTQGETKAYIRALVRAQKDLDQSPDKYKHYWKKLLATDPDLLEISNVKKFGVGETLVQEPYTESEYLRTLTWMKSWGLTERMLEESYQKITV